MKVRFLSFIAFVLMSACSTSPETPKKTGLEYPKELEQVHELIIQRKMADARLKVEDYINRAENIHWYGHAYFLKGFLFELDENYEDAIRWYREAIQHGSKYESRVEAKALYNLSFVYEKLDQRQSLVSCLVDLMKRREFFDILTGQVEIPARLAAAYASEGRLKEGMIFHREASSNFSDLVRNSRFQSKKSEIAKSLYYLGFATFDDNDESFQSLLRKLTIGQKYFLASAEASKSTWSEKAVERLQSQYDKAWGMVLEFRPEGLDFDPQAKKKQQHREQLVMASQFYDLMFKLRAEEFPMGEVNPRSKSLNDVTGQWINKIEKFAMTLQVGPETIHTQKIKNTRLAQYVEEKFEEVSVNPEQSSSKKDPTGSSETEKQLPEQQDIGKDPNL